MGEEFLNRVYKTREIQAEENKKETDEIEQGVRQMIETILGRLKENRPVFDVAAIIPTGSFYEGTKVGAPQEFDFMLTLAKLSKPDRITLHPGCSVWYPYIKVQPGVEFPQEFMFNMFYDGEHKDKDFLGSPRILVQEFWKEIEKVLDSLRKSSFELKMRQGTMSLVPCESRKLQFLYQHKFEYESGLPEKYDAEREKSMYPVRFLYIDVDLMLAIDHPSVESVLHMAGFPKHFEELLRKHKCHVIPKSCHKDHMAQKHCWFVTFSSIEREVVSKMDLHHKKCYKILKSLISSDISISRKCMNLSSYTLKTAFLFHVYGETRGTGCSNSKTLSTCIMDVLNYLSSNLFHTRMPCFFARDMNTWGQILETPWFTWTVSDETSSNSEAFKLCWVKLMYRYVKYLENIITRDKPLSDEELENTNHRCCYFKKAVEQIMKHYSRQKGYFKVEGNPSSIECCTDEFFSEYIQNLQKCHNIDFSYLL